MENPVDWLLTFYRIVLIIHWSLCYQDYKSACEAFFDGFKLDPENAEIENALRYPFFSLNCGRHVSHDHI